MIVLTSEILLLNSLFFYKQSVFSLSDNAVKCYILRSYLLEYKQFIFVNDLVYDELCIHVINLT